jgi:hypothetical protein
MSFLVQHKKLAWHLLRAMRFGVVCLHQKTKKKGFSVWLDGIESNGYYTLSGNIRASRGLEANEFNCSRFEAQLNICLN